MPERTQYAIVMSTMNLEFYGHDQLNIAILMVILHWNQIFMVMPHWYQKSMVTPHWTQSFIAMPHWTQNFMIMPQNYKEHRIIFSGCGEPCISRPCSIELRIMPQWT